MSPFFLIALLCVIAILFGERVRAQVFEARPSASPLYYGVFAALITALPPFALILVWLLFENAYLSALWTERLQALSPLMPPSEIAMTKDALMGGYGARLMSDPDLAALSQLMKEKTEMSRLIMSVLALLLSVGGGLLALKKLQAAFPARLYVEKSLHILMLTAATIGIATTGGIFLSLIFEALRFFQLIDLGAFLFGTEWSPQTALREGQVGGSGDFGALPLFWGTFFITLIAMLVAGPIGLFSAIFMAEYARPAIRKMVKPLLEILAGIPTVVYGFFAALTVAPFLKDFAALLDMPASSESALAAGLVMGIMIIPFVSSLSDDVITAVPEDLRAASYALGATHSETIKRVVLPAALPGIAGAFLLAISRAIGETMIVVMAAGLAAKLTANPLEAVTTVTVQIVVLLVGDQEFDSAKTLSAFALGLTLFLTTLFLNGLAIGIVRRYRERYE